MLPNERHVNRHQSKIGNCSGPFFELLAERQALHLVGGADLDAV
jgi:hypothetical protein